MLNTYSNIEAPTFNCYCYNNRECSENNSFIFSNIVKVGIEFNNDIYNSSINDTSTFETINKINNINLEIKQDKYIMANTILKIKDKFLYNKKKLSRTEFNTLYDRLDTILDVDELEEDGILPNISSFICLMDFIILNKNIISEKFLISIDNEGKATLQKSMNDKFIYIKFLNVDEVKYTVIYNDISKKNHNIKKIENLNILMKDFEELCAMKS